MMSGDKTTLKWVNHGNFSARNIPNLQSGIYILNCKGRSPTQFRAHSSVQVLGLSSTPIRITPRKHCLLEHWKGVKFISPYIIWRNSVNISKIACHLYSHQFLGNMVCFGRALNKYHSGNVSGTYTQITGFLPF